MTRDHSAKMLPKGCVLKLSMKARREVIAVLRTISSHHRIDAMYVCVIRSRKACTQIWLIHDVQEEITSPERLADVHRSLDIRVIQVNIRPILGK